MTSAEMGTAARPLLLLLLLLLLLSPSVLAKKRDWDRVSTCRPVGKQVTRAAKRRSMSSCSVRWLLMRCAAVAVAVVVVVVVGPCRLPEEVSNEPLRACALIPCTLAFAIALGDTELLLLLLLLKEGVEGVGVNSDARLACCCCCPPPDTVVDEADTDTEDVEDVDIEEEGREKEGAGSASPTHRYVHVASWSRYWANLRIWGDTVPTTVIWVSGSPFL